MKTYQKIFNFLTLGIIWFIRFFSICKKFVKVADVNGDGKISLTEIKKISKDVLNGDAEISIKYKEKK